MLSRWLFRHIDNSSLIVFRIIFGLLCFLEAFGAILTGWVERTLIVPQFTFSFIGFEWLQPLPGYGMYIYYILMSVFGLLIMVGYKYRFSIIGFTLFWAGSYFMQKTSYNNHYYLLILLSAIMVFMPANKRFSVDAKQNPSITNNKMPQWCKWVFVIQLFIVYSYASVAKFYPDWIDTTVIELLMRGKSNYYLIGELLQQKWLHYVLAYGGILFDGLIIPLLLFKPTRKYAFFASIFFHLFNSIVFQIGIFPYLSLAFSLFFFEPKIIHKLFFKKQSFYDKAEIFVPKLYKPIFFIFIFYFAIQIILPLRHHFIQDNVLWTEEGHRLSWRMMLRVKSGIAVYKVKDKATGEMILIDLDDYLTSKQKRNVASKPDFIWQFSQYLKDDFKAKGQDVAVYVDCKLSVNGKPYRRLVDPDIDIANQSWEWYQHSDWILPSKDN